MRTLFLIAIWFFGGVGFASAEVKSVSENGFVVSQTYSLKAVPEAVFAALLQPKDWWASDHTWSGDANNLSLEGRLGGCFCERLKSGAVRHMEIIYFDRNAKLVLQGGLGPLQSMPVQAVMTITLKPVEGGTELTVTYAVGGYNPDGFEALSKGVDWVLGQQFSTLAGRLNG